MALNKLPDIDIDFAHDRKDDVVDLIFERYGPRTPPSSAGFSTYQGRRPSRTSRKCLASPSFKFGG